MRQIVLDTETTGLESDKGHRIIELGCVELVNRRATQRTFHRYLCPDRDIEEGALKVHGITQEFLANQPRFADIAEEFLSFVGGSELIIHNASFDVAFIDMELGLLPGGTRKIAQLCQVLDTLLLAREIHPGQRNSLDALCKRYNVDNSNRDLHGALLDAKILSEVYLAMTGGQATLTLGPASAGVLNGAAPRTVRPQGTLAVLRASEDELQAHERSLARVDKASGGKTLWRASQFLPAPAVEKAG